MCGGAELRRCFFFFSLPGFFRAAGKLGVGSVCAPKLAGSPVDNGPCLGYWVGIACEVQRSLIV